MSWIIATPARFLSPGGDRRKAWPEPLGGATGTVESPSRDAAARGEGIPQRYDQDPPLDGDSGFVDTGSYSPPPFDWSTGGWHGSPRYPMPEPRGLRVTQYLRMRFANVAGIVGFSTFGQARGDDTTNTIEGATGVSSPVPFDRKRLTETFRELFDNRIYADYWPQERLQVSQWPREIARGVRASQPQMLEPYFPLLTRYTRAGSYGSRTQTIVSPTPGTPPGAA